jgi:hypothetical protein
MMMQRGIARRVVLRSAAPAAPAAFLSLIRSIHSPPAKRAVKVENLKVDSSVPYPTLYHGLDYDINIFGFAWSVKAQRDLQSFLWNDDCFLPSKPAQSLEGTPFAVLSDIGSVQAAVLADGKSKGLVANNELRKRVKRDIVDAEATNKLFDAFVKELGEFVRHPTEERAQLISNVAFWCQWLIRGVLYEGKLHNQKYTDAVIPAPLSTLAFAANAALGRHQIEFVYDDYTLKAANFPKHRTYRDVDYKNPSDIVKFIEEIDTPVGFNDMAGGLPEHNFRHNHSLMEQQMREAIAGWRMMNSEKATGKDIEEGWRNIALAAERAHEVFKTMMTNTPADTYPAVRLPIKGVRGGCGSVYPPNGVFYESCGTHEFDASGKEEDKVSMVGDSPKPGCYVDREFGQTGANSSMYKWLDIFVGVTQKRDAYNLRPEQKELMLSVLKGDVDPGDMGTDPIDSMQRAFDLLTRPPLHLDTLVTVARAVENGPYLKHKEDPRLKDNWELAAYHRFRTAFYVASHRNVHGKYVLKMIYQTKPVGGQSRAEGTGGSTPPFLKIFFDQTFAPAMTLYDDIIGTGRKEVLGEQRIAEMTGMRAQLRREMEQMGRVQKKGLELEAEEKRKGSGCGGW